MAKRKVYNPNDFRYQPVDYDSFVVIYDRIKIKLIEIDCGETPLYNNLEKTFEHIKRLLDQADRSCCGQVRANGFFSYGKILYKFFECIDQELCTRRTRRSMKEFIEHFNQFSDLFCKQNEFVCYLLDETNLDDDDKLKELEEEFLQYPEFYRQLKMYRRVMVTRQTDSNYLVNNNSIGSDSMDNSQSISTRDSEKNASNSQQFNSLPLFSPHLQTLFKSINEAIFQPNTKHRAIIYRAPFMFWIDSGLVSFFKFYIFVVPFFRAHLYSYPHLLLSGKFRSKILNKAFTTGVSLQWPFEFWNLSETRMSLLFIKYQTRKTNTRSREVHIPTQNSIEINESPFDRLTINDMNEIKFIRDRTIRCKYITPRNVDISNCEKVVLHMHGGGFFSNRCDSHEIYLRSWVGSNQIPILTIDYRVKRAFPAGHQDCLSVYIWMRKAPVEEVKSILGFYPKKIVCIGDSAGGNLALGITLVLNDLRTDYKSQLKVEIQMPDGLIPIYSPFLINTSISPSRILSSFDTLVPVAVQLVILHGISGFVPGLRPNTRLEILKTYLFPFNDPKPWFDCPEEELKEKCNFLAKIITSPYLTPLFYDKFDQLTDVPMHLISAEYCSFLDESITLAKLWQGSLKVDVMPNLCHGFLNLNFAGKNVKNAEMFCGDKVAEIFDTSR